LVDFRVKSEKANFFLLNIFKRKKEKKESDPCSGGFKRSQVFLKKYYPMVVLKSEVQIFDNASYENVRVEIFSKTRRA